MRYQTDIDDVIFDTFIFLHISCTLQGGPKKPLKSAVTLFWLNIYSSKFISILRRHLTQHTKFDEKIFSRTKIMVNQRKKFKFPTPHHESMKRARNNQHETVI